MEDPVGLIVDAPQRQQIGRLGGVVDASLRERDVDAGFPVVQKLNVLDAAIGLPHFHFDARARQDFPVLVADRVICLVFLPRGDRDLRGRRRNKKIQGKPGSSRNTNNHRQGDE